MRRASSRLLSLALLLAAALPLAAQDWPADERRGPTVVRPFVAGTAGIGVDLNDQDGRTGADFGAGAMVGVRLRSLSVGGEWTELSYGGDRKARILGGFLRAHAFVGPRVQPYLVLGLGAYRFTPSSGGSSTTIGGSFGPGATFDLGQRRVRLLLEARFHTTFDQYANLTRQEILSAMVGLQLGL